MKKLLYLFVIIALAASCSSEPKYILTGTIDGVDTGMVVLQLRTSEGAKMIDSATLKEGSFKMEGSVEYPQMAFLSMKNDRRMLFFFLENSKIDIAGSIDSLDKASVTGSAIQTEFETFRASFDEHNIKMRETIKLYRDAQRAGDEAKVAGLRKEMTGYDSIAVEMNKEFVINNPKSYLTPLVLGEVMDRIDASELETLISGLDTSLNKVAVLSEIKERVALLKSIAIGQKAPDFTMNDINGNPVSLYSKIGGNTKLLLVDFWAAWCNPCREENPNVVKVWKEFHKKGFDVFGVSLDSNGEDWKSAIEKDQLTWTHVSDLKFWNSEVAKLYDIRSIPANFLLDENGVIIDRDLRGEALNAKVREILGAK